MKKLIILLLCLFSCFSLSADIINGGTDPAGVPRSLIVSPIYAGFDSSQTTSIKNHILTHLSGTDRIITLTTTSHLVLQNTVLELDSSYTFSHGVLEIVGDVSIEGNGKEFYFGSCFCLIRAGSRLRVGNGVTFIYTPTGKQKGAIHFEDSTGTLELDRATLKVDNDYGMQFNIGTLEITSDSVIDNTSTDTRKALILGYGTTDKADGPLKVNVGAALTVKKAGVVWRNKGVASLYGPGEIKVEKTGNFIFEDTADLGSGAINLRAPFLRSQSTEGDLSALNTTQVASFDSPSATIHGAQFRPQGDLIGLIIDDAVDQLRIFDGTLTQKASVSISNNPYYVHWDPYGLYVASFSSANDLDIFQYDFNTSSLIGLSSSKVGVGASARSLSWSPDSRFLLVGGNTSSNELKIAKFTPEASSKISVVLDANEENQVWSAEWSPNGRFFSAQVIGADEKTGKNRIYSFDNYVTTSLLTTDLYNASRSGPSVVTRTVAWNPDGRHFALVDINDSDVDTLYIYDFDGSKLTLVSSLTLTHGFPYSELVWSNDGRMLVLIRRNGDSTTVAFDGTARVLQSSYNLGSDEAFRHHFRQDDKFSIVCFSEVAASYEARVYPVERVANVNPPFKINNGTIKLKGDMKLDEVNFTS